MNQQTDSQIILTPPEEETFDGIEVIEEPWTQDAQPPEDTIPIPEEYPSPSGENPRSPSPNQIPPSQPCNAPKKRPSSLQLRQTPSKRQQQEQKQEAQQEAKRLAKKQMRTTNWIVQWAKENITPTEINCLLGKSSLVIKELEESIITSFTSPPQKTGGITASLEKLLDPKNTNVLKLHVFSACLSILLPALIVQHLSKFSPSVTKKWQCASLIHWELILNKQRVTVQVPKGRARTARLSPRIWISQPS
ncbi:hypothetical protein RR48_02489 [Papilio machaon]|uniref:Uncharacterized protein n=1 Tax=Papilio machaon TaxID=76193 RepID=A0A0N1I538_PAPMA|nr:hypothetical protein RR48_02489 [Papilio machaon]